MRRLHHFVLSPFCRKVRLVLGEKKLGFEPISEIPWERSRELVALNPSAQVPVMIEENGVVIADSNAIAEYLEEVHPEPPLMPALPAERAEVRRLVAFFDQLIFAEVTAPLLRERILKRFGWGCAEDAAPDPAAIRAALDALRKHLSYMGDLTEKRGWLAGALSLADFAAAAHLSCIDYLGDVDWDGAPRVRDWYARIKSRPCFRPLLVDHLPGVQPPRHYTNLDF
ncbi:MAG: glutathione S-transferase family protein [Alphaproteobacteria bacterium]|nr:glutathione S-transferase family protein [Alphaproteobacteria bacterium]